MPLLTGQKSRVQSIEVFGCSRSADSWKCCEKVRTKLTQTEPTMLRLELDRRASAENELKGANEGAAIVSWLHQTKQLSQNGAFVASMIRQMHRV